MIILFEKSAILFKRRGENFLAKFFFRFEFKPVNNLKEDDGPSPNI